jgi:hypothetical protein
VRDVKAWLMFLLGVPFYAVTGRTPERSYLAMRRLSARTDGRLNDAWRAVARRVKPYRLQPVDGFLGRWTVAELRQLASQLEQDGIAMVDRMLPEEVCADLEAHARVTPAIPLGGDSKAIYSSQDARALRYDLEPDDILRAPAAHHIARDGTFTEIAGAYFGARPKFDFIAMWWTTALGPRDLSAAAQQFHYDMDRLFFLKFFVYLTDVTPETGPHVYVRGSHRRKPSPLRADRRFDDNEVERCFPEDQIMSVTGGRGTVFAADTRGLHKGAPVIRGERLVLQVEYAIDRFGQNYAVVQ